MAAVQLAGLASGFDWKTFTDSVIDLERAPVRRLELEKSKNDAKKSQLTDLGTKLASLRTAMSDLSSTSLSSGRKATFESSSPSWTAEVTDSTPVGSYEVQVLSKATASRLTSDAVSSPTAAGSLTINGRDIAITADQTVASVISAINNSNAGVTAIYSASAASGAGRIVLTNRDTGATAITVSSKDAAGSADPAIATSLGLASPTTNVAGSLAVFKVNGLDFTSANNTLDSADHGITGLSVKADAVGTENITVASSTSDLKAKIEAFVSNYNAVADFIDSKTKITTTAGKTSAGSLADNREIQTWLRELRSTAFRAPGSGEIANLSALGIDFSSTSEHIKIKDSAMLDAALSDRASDVVKFFNTSSTGLASAFVIKLDSYAGSTGTGGRLNTKIESYGTANTGLDNQIAALDRYLTQRRSQLESGFMAMENAQSKLKQMQTQLTNAFPNK
jgi:flagellar hook-associated protein 2